MAEHKVFDHDGGGSSGSGDDTGIHRIIPAKGDSPAKRRQKVIVLGTIILVVLTFLILRGRSSGGSSASGDASGVDSDGNDFTPAGSSNDSGDYGAQLAGEIGSIPNQVASALNAQTMNRLIRARTNARMSRKKEHRERTALQHQREESRKLRHRNQVLRRELRHDTHRHHKPIHHKGKKAG